MAASWQIVQNAFSEALELSDPATREHFLWQALDGDASLVEEVKEMLRAHEGRTPLEIERRLLGECDEDLSGERIGGYRLVRLIARGGMGEVYAAEREGGSYRQTVALKLLRQTWGGAEARRRFGQERQILARLMHPSIVPLLDGGVTADGRPYLVLQHVDGEPLTAFCDHHRCGIEERARLMRDVARAVDYAHRSLVVHRDLKPSNILVTREQQVQLLDFGVAKLLDPDEEETLETRAEVRIMTLDYAAPEQVRGEPVTTATDVYALGVLLYELLAGRRPFEGERVALERRILDSEPPPPSSVNRAWARRLRGDLDTIIGKAMAREPHLRYASAADLARDIDRFLEGRPVVARTPGALYRIRKFVRRNRLATGVAAASAVALLALTAMLWQQSRVAARERDSARAEQEIANRVTALIVEMLESANPESVPGGGDLTMSEFLKKASSDLAAKRDVDPEVKARLHHTLGKAYMARSRFEEARGHFEAARAGGVQSAEVLHDLALLESRAGDPRRARRLFEESLERLRKLHPGDHHLVAAAMQDLGEASSDLRLLEDALAMRRRLFAGPHMSIAASLGALGVYYYTEGRMDLAERYLDESRAVLEKVVPADHPNALSVLGNLSVIYSKRGRFAEAEALERRLLEARIRVLGAESLSAAINWGNLGTVLAHLGRYGESEAALRTSLRLHRKVLGPEHPQVANALRNLGTIRMFQGHHAEALTMLREAAAMMKRSRGTGAGHLLISARAASVLLRTGRGKEAIGELRALVEQCDRIPSKMPYIAADLRLMLGYALLAAGEAREAEGPLRQALEWRRSSYPEEYPAVAEAECGVGASLAMQARGEGREMLARCLPRYRKWGLADPVYIATVERAR